MGGRAALRISLCYPGKVSAPPLRLFSSGKSSQMWWVGQGVEDGAADPLSALGEQNRSVS